MATKEIQLADKLTVDQLLANFEIMSKKFGLNIPNSAGAHNALNGGRDLTSKYTLDQIYAMIAAGTFDDIFPGDYFTKDITVAGVTETVDFMFADLDTFLNNGDTPLTRHHAVIIPKDCFKASAQMNPTNTTEGGYAGSEMHKTVLPAYEVAIKTALGADHVLTHRSLLSTSMNVDLDSNAGAGWKGASNNWAWQDTVLRLMSEVQVYGSTVFSSSFYDVGEANTQFAVFRHNPAALIARAGKNGSRMWWWLSAVAGSATFARCYGGGASGSGDASYSGGVRPYFLIG